MSDKALPRNGWFKVKRYEPNSGGSSKYTEAWRPCTVYGFTQDADGEPCAVVEDERTLSIAVPYATWITFASCPPGDIDKIEKL